MKKEPHFAFYASMFLIGVAVISAEIVTSIVLECSLAGMALQYIVNTE